MAITPRKISAQDMVEIPMYGARVVKDERSRSGKFDEEL